MITLSPRQKLILAALMVAASTFVLYGGSLNNDFIGWDDEFYIFSNPYITPLSGATLWGMFSHFHFKSWTPLTLLSHALDYGVWSLDPRGHHLTNMVIHAMNCAWMLVLSLSVLQAYRRRSGAVAPDEAPGGWGTPLLAGAVVSALVFGWHPLRVESVACASSRKDLLSTFFALPSLLLYVVYSGRRGTRGSWRLLGGSAALYGLSLLAKGSGMTLTGILLIIDMISGGFGGGWTRWKRLIFEKIPFLILGIAAAIIAYIASGGGGTVVQALRSRSDYATWEIGVYNCAFYFVKTLWPARLAELYTYPLRAQFYIFAAVAPAATLAGVFLWWKGHRSWLYVWSAYVIALLPMAGFVPSSIQVIANRYAYFAAIPFCMLFGAAVTAGWERARRGGRPHLVPALLVPVSGVLLALGARTVVHVRDWRDAETVWRHTIAVTPGHALAYNELGLALMEKKEYPEAIANFTRAFEIYPEFSEAMCNMGGTYVSMGDTTDAERILRRALALSPRDYATLTNLGNVRMVEGKYAEAAGYYRQSLSQNPAAAVTTYDLGYAQMLLGNSGDALVTLHRALLLNPNHRDAYFLIGEILSKEKDEEDEALRAYRHAARLGHEQSQKILAARGLEW